MFKFDYSNTKESFEEVVFEAIKDGEYEVTIKEADAKETESGINYLNFQLEINKNFQQDHKGAKVYVSKFPDFKTKKFDPKWVNHMGYICGLNGGFSSLQEFGNLLLECQIKVELKMKKTVKDDKEYTNYNVLKWEKSGSKSQVSIRDEDLPF